MNHDLKPLFEALKTDLINAMQAKGSYGSGQIAKEITITTEGNKAQLQIPGILQTLEKGRGPTGNDAQRGSPPMIERIKQWCQEKGIPEREAWAIKKSIDKYGFKGKPGLLSDPLSTQNIDRRLKPVMESLAKEIIGSIKLD